jgi:hypothetical protein
MRASAHQVTYERAVHLFARHTGGSSAGEKCPPSLLEFAMRRETRENTWQVAPAILAFAEAPKVKKGPRKRRRSPALHAACVGRMNSATRDSCRSILKGLVSPPAHIPVRVESTCRRKGNIARQPVGSFSSAAIILRKALTPLPVVKPTVDLSVGSVAAWMLFERQQ